MPDETRVSVVMSVKNGEPYLADAIESILGQTFKNLTFVIVEDGSDDGSERILKDFAGRDRRVRVLKGESRGLTAGLNLALRYANTEYIARMDADDLAYPERLAEEVAYLDATPDCVLVGTGFRYIDPEGRPLFPFEPETSHEALVEGMLEGRPGLCHPSVLIRRSALDACGGYRECYETSQDLDLWLRLSEKGRVSNLPRVLMDYRVHPGAVSSARAKRQVEDAYRIVVDAAERLGRGAPRREGFLSEACHAPSGSEWYRYWGELCMQAGESDAAKRMATSALRVGPRTRRAWRFWLLTRLSFLRPPFLALYRARQKTPEDR